MFELFSCFEYQIYKKGKFSIKLCKKVIMSTWSFYSFNDKFLHEIKYVQSLKVMSTYEHLLANVLKISYLLIFLSYSKQYSVIEQQRFMYIKTCSLMRMVEAYCMQYSAIEQ